MNFLKRSCRIAFDVASKYVITPHALSLDAVTYSQNLIIASIYILRIHTEIVFSIRLRKRRWLEPGGLLHFLMLK